jgi:hypothetical protein
MVLRQTGAAQGSPLAAWREAQAAVTSAHAALAAAKAGADEYIARRILECVRGSAILTKSNSEIERFIAQVAQLAQVGEPNSTGDGEDTNEVRVAVGRNCGLPKKTTLIAGGLEPEDRGHWHGFCDSEQLRALQAAFGAKVTVLGSATVPTATTIAPSAPVIEASPTALSPTSTLRDASIVGSPREDTGGPAKGNVAGPAVSSLAATTEFSLPAMRRPRRAELPATSGERAGANDDTELLHAGLPQ